MGEAMKKAEQATPWRGLLIGGVAAGADGGFPRPNDFGTHRHTPMTTLHALDSHPLGLGTALVGMERAKAGGGSCWRGYARGYCPTPTIRRVLCLYCFSRMGTEFSVSSSCWRLEKSPGQDFVGGGVPGACSSGCGPAILIYFASAPRTLFRAYTNQPVGISRLRSAKGKPLRTLSDQCLGSYQAVLGFERGPELAETITPVGQC